MVNLTPDELRRYARQILLPEVGWAGQVKLREASVLCVGAGGLGSPAALYLAAAGVGRLGLVEDDRVDISNLQRQILHRTVDVGRPKAESARETLEALNPAVQVELHPTRLTQDNALDLIRNYDLVVDGTDNFPTRFLVNDACVFLGKANVYGAVLRFEGQASLFAPHRGGPCYRCLFPEPPPAGTVPNCAEAGVLGVVPGVIGTVQAAEALKVILQAGQSLQGRLLVFDALRMSFREIRVVRDPGCPVCGEHPTLTRLETLKESCPTAAAQPNLEVGVRDMWRALQDPAQRVRVLDVREPSEHAVACVVGTEPMPFSLLDHWVADLDPVGAYYLCCRSGGRSLRAVETLKQRGFSDVKSVHGGLLAWVREIDPQLPIV